MVISYSCAARLGDILSLKHNQMLNEGLFIRQGKNKLSNGPIDLEAQ